ncbi:MAG: hypothetical protein LC802_22740 [Acidobacteria bacterium]|nr:hypothetical protein [Acidobacteriota bacterium]
MSRFLNQMFFRPLSAFYSGIEMLSRNARATQTIDGVVSRLTRELSRTEEPDGGLFNRAALRDEGGARGPESNLEKGGELRYERVAVDPTGRQSALSLTEQDRAIIGRVEPSLAAARSLKRWQAGAEATRSYDRQYELIREFNPSSYSYAFLDQLPLDGRVVPVMGAVDDSLYDQPKQAGSQKVLEEFREFVLRYFMRVSAYQPPEASVGMDAHPAYTRYLSRVSWCPQDRDEKTGFGFSQLYYKLRDTGEIGKFPPEMESRIVDLREIGVKYEWVVLKVKILQFNLSFRLLGSDVASLVVPLVEDSYLAVCGDFILNQDKPAPGVLGRYGFGYAFLKNLEQGLFAYGPGEFDTALQLIDFHVLDSGEIRSHLTFVANRPTRLTNVEINPVQWGYSLADLLSFGVSSAVLGPLGRALERIPLNLGSFDPIGAYVSFANQLTGGLARRDLCISLEQLERDFLVQHFQQHYQMLVGSLLTWRQIPNWLDSSTLPEWVRTGKRA